MNYEQLWAPWRLAYISGNQEKQEAGAPGRGDAQLEPGAGSQRLLAGGDPTCFLCRAASRDDDRQRLVVQHGQLSITILNRYPYNNGHLLVAPARHIARLSELTDDESLEVSRTISQMVELLERTIRAEGFNVGLNLGKIAGAGLPGHLHWHIVPRWSGDTNFMPVAAGVRVIPQSLEALWEILTSGPGTGVIPSASTPGAPAAGSK